MGAQQQGQSPRRNREKPPIVRTTSTPRRPSTEVFFSEDLLSPVTYFSDHSTASESSFYDYLLTNPGEPNSNIRRELFETFNAAGTAPSLKTETLRNVVPGYSLLSNISSDLYRGFSRSSKRSVLVKYVSYMSAGSISRFFNEWYTLSGINPMGQDGKTPDSSRPPTLPLGIEGVLYPVDFVSIERNGGYALIYEDVLNLRSFNEVFVMGRVKDTTRLLTAMIQCTETLQTIHSHRITHNGLTSSNILINDAEEVYITGWDFCFSFHAEDCTRGYRTLNKRYLIDWLPFMAPEVSGETNCFADHRADFYSLGVIMYQLFTSQLPFIATDARELINKHIKEQPRPLSDFDIHGPLSSIIMKLLAKREYQRYPSCDFLLDDLKYALTGIETTSQDLEDRQLSILFLPRGIYGREKEMEYLESLYDTVGNGVHLLLIKGAAGVGKTRLVNELQSRIVSGNHFFASWKCNSKTTGFASFISIVNNILHQITASSEADIVAARESIIRVVGSSDLSPLFVHFPELKDVLGPNYVKIIQHEKLNSNDIRGRPEFNFRRLLKSLFIALGNKYPLTLLFDDFQWFSLSDIELLNEIRTEILKEQHESCLIILATFDSSDEEHLGQFKRTINSDYMEITLDNLGSGQSFNFIKETFAPDLSIMSIQPNYPKFFERSDLELQEMSQSLLNRVGGNALMSVHVFDQLIIDDIAKFEMKSPYSYWNYNMDKINALPLTLDGIYDMRINQFFNEDEKSLLKFAACIYDNTTFSLDDLVVASQRPLEDISRVMCKALESWLIRPMNIFYKFPFHLRKEELPIAIEEKDMTDLSSLALFSLCHDTLYTYIVSQMMDEEELAELHKTIGLRFYHGRKNVDSDTVSCMEIASHFAKSYTAVTTSEEEEIYLEVLSMAQIFCYKIFDFVPALKFLRISKALVEKRHNKDDKYNLFEIDYEITKCMLKTQNVQGVIDFIDSHVSEFREDPKVVLVYIQALSIVNRGDECIQLATRCLNKNDIAFSPDRETFESQKERLANQMPSSMSEIRTIVRDKGQPSESQTILQEIMAELLFLAMYRGESSFADVLSHYIVICSLENGASGFAAVGYIGIAILNVSKSMSASKELSQFALFLLKTTKTVTLDFCNKVFYIYVFSIGVYLEPVAELLKFYELYSHSSTHTSSSWSINFIMRAAIKPTLEYLNGSNLQNIYNMLLQSVRKIDLEDNINRAWYNTAMTMMRHSLKMPYDEKYDVLKDESFSIDDAGFFFRCFYYSALQWIKAPHSGNLVFTKTLEEETDHVLKLAPFNLYSVLFILRRTFDIADDPHNSVETKKEVLEGQMKVLHECKASSPKVFEAKYLLHQAEIMKLNNCSHLEILDAFEDAIETSKTYDIPLDVGSLHERCARWLFQIGGSKKRAKKHLGEAARAFQAGGFTRRVSDLKQSFPEEFDNFQLDAAVPASRKSTHDGGMLSPINYFISSVLSKEDRDVNSLLEPDQENSDFFRALKATLSVSESINTDAIIENLVKESVSIAHAEYAIVALRDDTGGIQYRAVGGPSFFNHLDPDDSDKLMLPRRMIKYIIETGNTVEGSSDAKHQIASLIDSDSYFIKSIPKSFVCLPIKSEIEILGALYLENSDIPRLFTKKKLKFTELLATQAAFALDKASLYYRTMLAKKAAEEATAEKATFLANMSHEIRTPFNSLFACAGFLLDTNLDPLQQEYVETVQSSAQVTLNIIDAILTFSRIEHGSIRLDKELFSLNECIESAMQLIAEQASHKNIELAYFNKCGNIDMISGDMVRFKQIVINLLGNSVKFTQEGSIVVKSYTRKLATDDSYEFTVSIEDTGIGIPTDSQSKVFGAFSQVDGSSRRVYGGSGLGLAISKKLMDLMGGSIRFESKEGEGTTFFLTLTSSAKASDSHLKVPMDTKMLIIADESYSSLSLKEYVQAEAQCSIEITSSYESLNDLKEFLLVFITPTYYDKLPNSLLRSVSSSKIVLISAYGKIAKHSVKENHPVLLLPFLTLKLSKLIEGASNPGKSADPTPEANRVLAEDLPLQILLVEDNMVNTKVALLHLKKLGYIADSAVDGVDALEKCSERIEQTGSNYDLILMDIQMPRKDGLETARELKEKYGESALMPVIVALTANVEAEDKARCIECGMVDFISKPIRPAVLEKAIRDSRCAMVSCEVEG